MVNNLYTITPNQLKKYLRDIFYANLVPFVVSSPGIGKSSIAKQVGDSLELEFVDIRLSTMESVDINGYPDLSGERATFKPFDVFPLEGDKIPAGKRGWLICLDEFASASREVQVAAYRLILDRQVGKYNLHKNVAIVCLSNKSTDRAIVNEISTAMRSRLVNLELVSSFEDWMQNIAIPYKYDPRIIAFLNQYPSKLNDFNPEREENTYCCPRTWEFMNKILKIKKTADEKDVPLYAGIISPGVAMEFIGFTKIFKELPHIDEIVKDPENFPIPENIGHQWATVAHLEEKATKDNIGKVYAYINRFRLPIAIMGARMLQSRFGYWFDTPEGSKYIYKMAQYLFSDES